MAVLLSPQRWCALLPGALLLAGAALPHSGTCPDALGESTSDVRVVTSSWDRPTAGGVEVRGPVVAAQPVPASAPSPVKRLRSTSGGTVVTLRVGPAPRSTP